jgi:hypothetical protein
MMKSASIRAVAASLAMSGFAVVATATAPLVAQGATADKASAKKPAVDIMLMQPKDVKAGENQFEVMVKGADGKPLTGGDVSITFVMPKTATMAEMRNEVKLKASGPGSYMGPGNVMMAGKWTTTIMVMKDGKELGQKTVSLNAK